MPNNGNKPQENPPAATIGIVEPPDGYGEAWDQNRQAEDAAQQPYPRRSGISPYKAIDDGKHDTDDDDEQNEKPVLLTPGAPAENGVLSQCLDEPTQSLCPPGVLRGLVGLMKLPPCQGE